MNDQVQQLPAGLPGIALTGSRCLESVMKKILQGNCAVLYSSPERLAQDSKLVRHLKEVKSNCVFTCIDEAHCISEWGHDFRPSYAELAKTLRSIFGMEHTILALTATAPLAVVSSLKRTLLLSHVVRNDAVRSNLFLSAMFLPCAHHALRNSFNFQSQLDALLKIIVNLPSGEGSVIVYCASQRYTEEVASFLEEKSSVVGSVRAYHAGMDDSKRKDCQADFLSGACRIVVATVAFGMGINKLNVRAVIHFSSPSSVEQYVQEIGRAGRDGQPSECHVLVDSYTYYEHRRRIFSSALGLKEVSVLCKYMFRFGDVPATCNASQPYDAVLDVREVASFLDVEESHVMGVCSLIQSMAPQVVKINGQQHKNVSLDGGREKEKGVTVLDSTMTSILHQLSLRDKVLEFLMAKVSSKSSVLDVFATSQSLGVRVEEVRARIEELREKKVLQGRWSHSVFSLEIQQSVTAEFVDLVARTTYAALVSQQDRDVARLNSIFRILTKLSQTNDSLEAHEDLTAYMQSMTMVSDSLACENESFSEEDMDFIRLAVEKKFELSLSDVQTVKILYGIPTKRFNGYNSHVKGLWGKLMHLPFRSLVQRCS
eukprot:PhF_6_TR6188/c0_g1_i1/m.9285/K10730/RECQL4; ATP-dependent DNA helicase Q4